jgi:hypothetical protein
MFTQRSLISTIPLRLVVCKQPPGLLHLLNRGPWPEVKGGRGWAVIAGEEGHRWRGLRGGGVPQDPCAPLAARDR